MSGQETLFFLLLFWPVITAGLFLLAIVSFIFKAKALGFFLLGACILFQVYVFYDREEESNKITLTEPTDYFGLVLPAGTEIGLNYREDKFPVGTIDFPNPYPWHDVQAFNMRLAYGVTNSQSAAHLTVYHKRRKEEWFFFKNYQCQSQTPYTEYFRYYPDSFETFLSDSDAWIPETCLTPGAKIYLPWPALQEKMVQKNFHISYNEIDGVHIHSPFQEEGKLFNHDHIYPFKVFRLYLNSDHMADKMDIHLERLPASYEMPPYCSPAEQGILHSFQTDGSAIWESGDCPPERVKIEFPVNE